MSDENVPSTKTTANYERVIANWTRILGLSTLLLSFATGLSAYFLSKTDHTIATQIETSKLQSRAYVGVFRTEAVRNYEGSGDASTVSSLDIKITWKNFGYTPAFDLTWFTSVDWYRSGDEPDFSRPASNMSEGTPDTMAASGEIQSPMTLRGPAIQRALAGNGRIFVWGRVRYRDFASESATRYSAFCFYLPTLPAKREDALEVIGYKADCNKGN